MGLLSRIFGKERVEERTDEPDLVYVPDEDERMEWAIEKAGLTLWYFEESLRQPRPEQQYFSIKVKIIDGEHTEHIWLDRPEFDHEGNLFGEIGNAPINVKTVQLNQKIGIERSLISDWMIIEGGRLIGGYTIRAIRDGIPADELSKFDQSVGMYIDEGIDHFKPDFDTPEGAILSLEQAFREKDLNKALACKDFYFEAKLMLCKMEFGPDEEMIRNTAEVLEASFLKYMEEHGLPDFTGITSAFTRREKIDDKYWVITEVCFYPDGGTSEQRLNTYHTAQGWKVLNVAN